MYLGLVRYGNFKFIQSIQLFRSRNTPYKSTKYK